MTTHPDPDLQACIERAVNEWLVSDGGGMVTGSVTLVEFLDSNGEQVWAWSVSDQQHMSKTMGLVEWLRGLVRYEQTRHLHDTESDGQ